MGRQDGSERRVSDEAVDSATATILHVDLDAFFAAVELLDRPELVDKPVVVAHDSPRSVVTAANYPARKFGIRSATTLARARSLCPHVIALEPHFEKYTHYSRIVQRIFHDVTPLVEPLSIDEAFLDVSGAGAAVGSPAEIAALIRRRVRDETGLTASVGAAATKFVAKVASGMAKPDGLLVVPRAETLGFLHPLPVSALWGVGAVTEKSLRDRGLHTIQDVAHAPLAKLERAVGKAGASKLHQLANGVDPRAVSADTVEKSVGHEVTFDYDVADPDVLRRELLRQATKVGVRLRAHGVTARTVVLKLRYADFTTISRSHTLTDATDLGRRIYEEVRALYESLGEHRPVRLIGVRAEQLSHDDGQPALWGDDDGWRDAERTLDSVAGRFGRDAIGPARLLGTAPRGGMTRKPPVGG
ncbi:MAG: DNA polymerase IV [Cryobacterium sp.]|nr:DNA polymerase IV [Cryobacterium sp.]